MNSKVKTIGLTAIVLAAVCGSVLLPYRAQLYGDNRIFGVMHLQETAAVAPTERPGLPLYDKLRLLSGEKVTTVDAGKHYSEAEITAQCEAQAQLLYDKGVLRENPAEIVWNQKTAVASLLLEMTGASQGMILWTLTFSAEEAFLQCGMDDETGKILYFYQTDAPGESRAVSDAQMEAFADYLGASLAPEGKRISSLTATTVLPQEDSIQIDCQYGLIFAGGQLPYHVAKTEQGVFFGHNLLMPPLEVQTVAPK
ncbi:MAG: hypothetical protein RR502_05300 [Oscillospiraceae bacterium]